MSEFDSHMATAMDAIHRTFGGPATYTDLAGADTALTDATFCEHDPEVRDVRDGQAKVRTATATVAVADVASPAIGETFSTAAGEAWSVAAFHKVGGGTRWQLMLNRTEPVAKSRQAYRPRS